MDHSLDDEIRSYIEHETQLNIDRGMAPEAARAAALRKFGNRTVIGEEIFYQNRPALVHSVLQDVRYALRNLRRSPRFTLLAVLSLALGIGVDSSVFSVICGEVYPQLPYRDYPAIMRLVSVRVKPRGTFNLSAGDLHTIRQSSRSFLDLAATENVAFNTAAPSGPPERINAVRVTPNFLRFLGVTPLMGRDFHEDEGRGKGAPVALIGYGYWERRFSQSPTVLGQSVRLDGESYTVIGVLPPHFHWLSWHNTGCFDSDQSNCLDVYLPSTFESQAASAEHSLTAVARLAPRVAMAQADAEVRGIVANLEANWSARVETLDHSLHDLAPGFLLMQGAVAFVLLIACANVANLLLARGRARSREMAVRSAIGATRGRLVRQLLTEGLILALLASGLGLAFTAVGARLMSQSARLDLIEGAIDWRVVAFTLAVSMLSTLLFALFPALQVSRAGMAESLRLAGRGFTPGRGTSRMRDALVVAEIALSLVLLIAAGLMTRSLSALLDIPLGFDTRNLVFARLPLAGARYSSESARLNAMRQALNAVTASPAVTGAALVSGPPFFGSRSVSAALPADPRAEIDLPRVRYRAASAGYFQLLGVQVERGRDFAPADYGQPMIIVNRTLANSFWPGQDPIGQRLRIAGAAPSQVIGVMPDLKSEDMRGLAQPEIVALSEMPDRSPFILARIRVRPIAFLSSLQSVLAGIDPDLPVAEMKTMSAEVDNHVFEIRAALEWLSAFSLIAILMAAVGIYGVLSYIVAQSRQEIGIRIALGAAQRQIAGWVLGRTARLAAAGIIAGLALAAAVTRALRQGLYGVSPMDPSTFALAAGFLFVVALVAVIAPLRASTTIDPATALRE